MMWFKNNYMAVLLTSKVVYMCCCREMNIDTSINSLLMLL